MSQFLTEGRHVHSKNWLACLLLPVSGIFFAAVKIRSFFFRSGLLRTASFNLPIIVVGNISVGGTGKTPIVTAVVKQLQAAGLNPAIVSRGYGATDNSKPLMVTDSTNVEDAGDEPKLLAALTGVPVCICATRADAVCQLARQTNVDVIVSDDGMQHYAMPRQYEIAVVDGLRGLGNGWMLPAGPLREPRSRLRSVSIIAVQRSMNEKELSKTDIDSLIGLTLPDTACTGSFVLEPNALHAIGDSPSATMSGFAGKSVHAVAGVGNPSRFFRALEHAGLKVIEHPMQDHHQFSADDVEFNDELPVFVTAKDAVKLRSLDASFKQHYEVSVETVLDANLLDAFQPMIAAVGGDQLATKSN